MAAPSLLQNWIPQPFLSLKAIYDQSASKKKIDTSHKQEIFLHKQQVLYAALAGIAAASYFFGVVKYAPPRFKPELPMAAYLLTLANPSAGRYAIASWLCYSGLKGAVATRRAGDVTACVKHLALALFAYFSTTPVFNNNLSSLYRKIIG